MLKKRTPLLFLTPSPALKSSSPLGATRSLAMQPIPQRQTFHSHFVQVIVKSTMEALNAVSVVDLCASLNERAAQQVAEGALLRARKHAVLQQIKQASANAPGVIPSGQASSHHPNYIHFSISTTKR